MFAVVKTGGKQYRVAENDVIRVERLPGEVGEKVSLDQVLMMGDGGSVEVGAPTLAGKSVEAEILEQTRGDKIVIFKRKRRKGYRRKKGHRQDLTVLRITGIGTKPKAAKAKPKAESASAEKGEAAESKPAAKKSASAKQTGGKRAASKSAAEPSTAKKTASKSTAKTGAAAKSGTGKTSAASKPSGKSAAKSRSGGKSPASKSSSKKE